MAACHVTVIREALDVIAGDPLQNTHEGPAGAGSHELHEGLVTGKVSCGFW